MTVVFLDSFLEFVLAVIMCYIIWLEYKTHQFEKRIKKLETPKSP